MSVQSKAIEGVTEPSGNMSFEELVALRTQARTEPEPTEEEEPQETEEPESEEAEEVEETEEPEEGEETTEEEEEESPEEIDLLSLTPEQIQDLAKRGKSRLLSDIGKLRAEKRHLEQQLAAQAETKPLPRPIPAEENPFSNLKTVDELQAKFAELEKVAEETDRVLEDHEDYGAEDIINFAGKDFTKKEIRIANRNARNAMAKFLPAQHAEIMRSEQRKVLEEQYNAAIPVEIPELADESSDMAKQFNAILADPLIEQVRQRVPELSPQLGYLLAHAVRSLSTHKPKTPNRQAAPGTTPKPKVAGSPVGAAAAKSGGKPVVKKQAEQAYQAFENSGSVEDWIAARAARNL